MNEKKPLKVMIFRQNESHFDCICTVENAAMGIDSINYHDLTDDGVAELLLRQPPGFHKGQQHGFLIFVQKFAVGLAGDPAVIFDAFQSDRFHAASPPFHLNCMHGTGFALPGQLFEKLEFFFCPGLPQAAAIKGERPLADFWIFLIAKFPSASVDILDYRYWRAYIVTADQLRSCKVTQTLRESALTRLGLASFPFAELKHKFAVLKGI